MTRTLVLTAALTLSLIPLTPAPATAQRRIDASKEATKLLDQLVKARGDKADSIEQKIAVLATDLIYMDDVEPVLIRRLASRSTKARRTAARLLRYTISGAAVQPLARILGKDRSEDVRMEAVTSLCILKADAALGTLRNVGTADKSQRVRAAANAAIDVIEDRDGGARKGCRHALQTRLAAL